MRALFLATALLTASVPAVTFAQATPAPAPAPGAAKFSTATSTIATMMADPAAKAVLDKFIPQLAAAAGQIGGQTLKQLQGMAGDALPDKLLADIDADLAKIK